MAPESTHGTLNATWDQFVADCQNAFPHAGLTKSTDIETTTLQLRKLIPQDSPESQKRSKNVMLALECVKVIGGIVAKSATCVFGPAEVCGNAIALVVDGVKKGTAAFDNVAALMERISAFLDALSIHVQQEDFTIVPRALTSACEQVLKHFLTVLKQIYKLTHSKRERFRIGLKAFLDDNEIKTSLEQMEALISSFTRTEIATILAKVSLQAQDIGKLRGGVDILVNSQTLEDIKTALAVGKISEENEYVHTALTNEVLEGTGLWLTEEDEGFKAWAEFDESSTPFFAIQELKCAGGTMLSNHVIRHLEKTNRTGEAVAYYYFPERQINTTSLGHAFRCLIWQLVQRDAEYGHFLAGKLKESSDHGTPLSLWKQLYEDRPGQSAVYIVLDGLHTVDARAGDILARMITDVGTDGQSPYRLFLSGRPTAWRTINSSLKAMQQPPVETQGFANRSNRRNARDIELYIAHHLKKDIWDEDTRDLIRRTMIEMLVALDLYPELHSHIQQLNKCLLKETVEHQLIAIRRKCQQASIEGVASAIVALERRLLREQIQELNLILSWLIALGGKCELALLDEVLALKQPALRGMSLLDRIEPYSRMVNIGAQRKYVRFNGNMDVFAYMDSSLARERRDKLNMERRNANRTAKSTGWKTRASLKQFTTPTVPDSEVELMRAFLKTFCKPDMYAKSAFDEFFDSKLRPSERNPKEDREILTREIRPGFIFLDKQSGHHAVIETCLEALLERNEDTSCSQIYNCTRRYLAEQLDAGRGKGHPDETIIRLLVQFLKQPSISAQWQSDRTYLRKLCKAIQKWFARAGGSKYLQSRMDTNLAVSFQDSSEPENVLLAQMALQGRGGQEEDAAEGSSR